MPLDIIDRAYEQAQSAARELSHGRKRKIWKIVGNSGGETIYIGSWNSGQYGYIYNNEVQSEDPLYTRCWRYEVRFKNDLAKQVYHQLAQPQDSRLNACATIVRQWFLARGITVPWDCDTGTVFLPIIKTQPSDIERTLWWLERQVRPPLQRVIEAGFYDKALLALGILL